MKEELTVILILIAPFIGMTILFAMIINFIFPILSLISIIIPYILGIIFAGGLSFLFYFLIIARFY